MAGLQDAFLSTPYADLEPAKVEAPFLLVVDGRIVRGRVDAAYERDGRFEVVDFKTGRTPAEGDPGANAQLDLYAVAVHGFQKLIDQRARDDRKEETVHVNTAGRHIIPAGMSRNSAIILGHVQA